MTHLSSDLLLSTCAQQQQLRPPPPLLLLRAARMSREALRGAGALLADAGDPRHSTRHARALLSLARTAVSELQAALPADSLLPALLHLEEARLCCARSARALRRARRFPASDAGRAPWLRRARALARPAAALAAAERVLGARDATGELLLVQRQEDVFVDGIAEDPAAAVLARSSRHADALPHSNAVQAAGYYAVLRSAHAAATLWRLQRELRCEAAAASGAGVARAHAADVPVADVCAGAVLRALRLARLYRTHDGSGAAPQWLLLTWEAALAAAMEALLASAPLQPAGWATHRCVAAAWARSGDEQEVLFSRLRAAAAAHAAFRAARSALNHAGGAGGAEDDDAIAAFYARRAPPTAPLRRCALPACGALEAHTHEHKACGRCRAAVYCSEAHAAAHWRDSHSHVCIAAAQQQPAQ